MDRVRAYGTAMTVVLLAACTQPANQTPDGSAAAGGGGLAVLLAADHATAPPPPTGPAAPLPGGTTLEAGTAGGVSTPETVAGGTVTARLADEQLDVHDLHATVVSRQPDRVQVAVTVLYGTRHSHPVHGVYTVTLVATGTGWTVASVEAGS